MQLLTARQLVCLMPDSRPSDEKNVLWKLQSAEDLNVFKSQFKVKARLWATIKITKGDHTRMKLSNCWSVCKNYYLGLT